MHLARRLPEPDHKTHIIASPSLITSCLPASYRVWRAGDSVHIVADKIDQVRLFHSSLHLGQSRITNACTEKACPGALTSWPRHCLCLIVEPDPRPICMIPCDQRIYGAIAHQHSLIDPGHLLRIAVRLRLDRLRKDDLTST